MVEAYEKLFDRPVAVEILMLVNSCLDDFVPCCAALQHTLYNGNNQVPVCLVAS